MPQSRADRGNRHNTPKAGAYRYLKGYTQPVKCGVGVVDESGAIPTWTEEEVEEEQVARRRIFEFEAGVVRQPLSEQQTVNEEAKKWSE